MTGPASIRVNQKTKYIDNGNLQGWFKELLQRHPNAAANLDKDWYPASEVDTKSNVVTRVPFEFEKGLFLHDFLDEYFVFEKKIWMDSLLHHLQDLCMLNAISNPFQLQSALVKAHRHLSRYGPVEVAAPLV